MKNMMCLMVLGVALFTSRGLYAQSLNVPHLDPAYQSKLWNHVQQMTPEQMANMQAALMEGHRCMAQMDQATRTRLQRQGHEVGERIKALCHEGARDDAHYYARSQSEAFMRDPAMQQLRQCSERAASTFAEFMGSMAGGDGTKHVCDGL